MLQKLLFGKYIVLLVLLCGVLPVAAQYYTRSGQVVHSINLSLAGGMSMTHSHWATGAPLLQDKAGGDGQVQLTYELAKDWFIFGLGVGFDYNYTRQHIDSFAHLFDRLDREQDPITYAYRYSDYNDEQQRMLVTVPLYLGAAIGDYFYLLAGAKAALPLQAKHTTGTVLSTDGTYQRFIHTIEDAPTYGYYAPDQYASTRTYADARWYLAPMLEMGANFTLNRRVAMRLGVFADYYFPFGATHNLPLVDYSAVDSNPMTQNKHNLQENILFNATTNANYCTKAANYWTVGLRWTCRFMFRRQPNVCRCLEM